MYKLDRCYDPNAKVTRSRGRWGYLCYTQVLLNVGQSTNTSMYNNYFLGFHTLV